MKLSKHDKNMIATSWLAEVLLNGLSQTKSNIPEEKAEQYNQLREQYSKAFDIVEEINKSFTHDVDAVFGQEYIQALSELTTIIAILYQTQDVNSLLKLLRWASANVILENRAKQEIKEAEVKDELN